MGSSFTFSVERSPMAPGAVRERLRSQLPAETLTDAVLLVASELIANAVVYGRAPIEVRVGPVGKGFRVEVSDGGHTMGTPRADSRGLQLVEDLTTAWGVNETPDGKVVWADIHLDSR
jgi:anti-sigma regulatory factor (Ser/Thr protein kinase)